MARPPEPFRPEIERPSFGRFIYAIRFPLIALVLVGLAFFVLTSTGVVETPDLFDVQSAGGPRAILTDRETGCQYIDASGTTPRIADDGVTHLGCRKTKP